MTTDSKGHYTLLLVPLFLTTLLIGCGDDNGGGKSATTRDRSQYYDYRGDQNNYYGNQQYGFGQYNYNRVNHYSDCNRYEQTPYPVLYHNQFFCVSPQFMTNYGIEIQSGVNYYLYVTPSSPYYNNYYQNYNYGGGWDGYYYPRNNARARQAHCSSLGGLGGAVIGGATNGPEGAIIGLIGGGLLGHIACSPDEDDSEY